MTDFKLPQVYEDERGLVFCEEHRREVCHQCCCDHRLTNMAMKHPNADWEALNERMDHLQEIEHRAMLQQWAAEGHAGPLLLGSADSHRLWEAVAAPPPSGQRTCGLPTCGVKGDRLNACGRCRAQFYCSKEHQVEHWREHRAACKHRAAVAAAAAGLDAAAAGAAEGAGTSGSDGCAADHAGAGSRGCSSGAKLISWRQLAKLRGKPAAGRVLELRIVSQPLTSWRHTFQGKDHKGDIHTVACYADHPPRGLALGRVLRWRNPCWHRFLDGTTGARIGDADLPNIVVTDS